MPERGGPSEDAVREGLRQERDEVDQASSPGARRGSGGSSDDAVARAETARSAEARMAAGTATAAESADASHRGDEPEQLDENSAVEAAGEPAEDEDPLTTLTRERDRYLDLARRTQADFDNYRKRAAKDSAAANTRAKTGLIRELLPVVDNLERALTSATESDTAIAEGVRLVHNELVGVLERNGVQTSEPVGEKFDPTEHEAISMSAQEGTESGIVLHVVEKGYSLNDTVIRPARVVVSG